MTFDHVIVLLTDNGKLLGWEADFDLHHLVALNAGQVVMVVIPTGPISVAAIGKVNPV